MATGDTRIGLLVSTGSNGPTNGDAVGGIASVGGVSLGGQGSFTEAAVLGSAGTAAINIIGLIQLGATTGTLYQATNGAIYYVPANGDLIGATLSVLPTLTNVTFTTTYGTAAGDASVGTSGANLIYGGPAAQSGSLETGTGNDTITAGAGNDTVIAGDGNDSVSGGDDNDMLYGGAGNDTLSGDGGNDRLEGGAGDDLLLGGAGADTLLGGDGNDTLRGGAGADSLAGGAGTDLVDYSDSGAGVSVNLATQTATGGDATGDTLSGFEGVIGSNFSDTLTGSAGADLILGGGGNDSIAGGAGNDTIDGGGGADTLSGGEGNDTITGGAGSDRLDGGAGDDLLDGGDGSDIFTFGDATGQDTILGGDDTLGSTDRIDGSGLTIGTAATFTGSGSGTLTNLSGTTRFSGIELLRTGAGDDTIDARAEANGVTIDAGAGGDLVQGGAGADSLEGGAGDDTLVGGAGADTLSGGAGNDLLVFGRGDVVSGGTGANSYLYDDTVGGGGDVTVTGAAAGASPTGNILSLGSATGYRKIVDATDPSTGAISGRVILADGTVISYSGLEAVICFTPGARILTAAGERPVESLRIGDEVVTRDHGLRPIRWIGRRTVPAEGRLAPVRIRAGTLPGLRRDLVVSPQHRMLHRGWRAELHFGASEVLAAARHMVDNRHVSIEEGGLVTYIHILFDGHQVIYAEGAATESFHPGAVGIGTLDAPAREELFAIFPELRADPNSYGRAARPLLKRAEAQLLMTG
ncbi:Hint domain-containing protein [Frigidibacter sp. MR17.24]|uniref:Hint domain-containing protein n=1 Tax=Frigidibacter sp. MR17.24 TaxID=3127345 RepID=UPI003012FB57